MNEKRGRPDFDALKEWTAPPEPELKRGPKPQFGKSMTSTVRARRSREADSVDRIHNIAILDTETDPFDSETEAHVFPFLAVLYSENFSPIVIWDENPESFVNKVITEIEALPEKYTIYAHNGGKFDYMFFLHKLRGDIKFKGRGLMSAAIGNHELRDSFHILPERLANWQKDEFDYTKMHRDKRNKYKDEIITYCIHDCKYLLQMVKKFLDECGLKISIGQAAMSQLKAKYKVQCLGELSDEFLRQWFYGGRVECLAGKGIFSGNFKLYDINSQYPFVMAHYQHPICNEFFKRTGKPNENTIFLELECENRGAFIGRTEDGVVTSRIKWGRFKTTIWEYNVAIKYNLISRVKIIHCLDFKLRSDFSDFIIPMYEKRQAIKKRLKTLVEDSAEWLEEKKDDYLIKYLLNNSYGKFAQNPRKYKDHYITAPGERPGDDPESWGVLPAYEGQSHWIWEKPNPGFHYNNVATAASITGAARSRLLEGIQNSINPIYCDTDSLICENLSGVEIDASALGAWDIERELEQVAIAGKKLYGMKIAGLNDDDPSKVKIKSKGVSGLTWDDLVSIIDNETVVATNKAPTISKIGAQHYMKRRIRATAKRHTRLITYRERLSA